MRPSTTSIAMFFTIVSVLLASNTSAQVTLHRVWQNSTGGTAYDVKVSDGLAFVSNNAGVAIFDVHDPQRPRLASLLDSPIGAAFGLSTAGSTLYVAAIQHGMVIVDVEDPENPEITGSFGRDVSDVFVHRNVAYVTFMFGAGTAIVDVGNPDNPVELAAIDSISGAAGDGDTVWVGYPGRGVIRLDVSDPTSPVERSVIPGTHGVNSLEYRDRNLYVARYSLGTQVYDVTNHASPRLLLDHPDTGESWHASGAYPLVCVADLQEGVEVLDGSLPPTQSLVARDDTLAPHSLVLLDGYIHVADQNDGYVLLQLERRPEPRRIGGRRVP